MANVTAQPRRRRTTSRRVYIVDAIAGAVISVGGLAVVAAVLGICVYLVIVAGRLFLPGSVGDRTSARFADAQGAAALPPSSPTEAPQASSASAPSAPAPTAVVGAAQLFIQPAEHLTALIALDRDAVVRFVELATGRTLSAQRVVPEGRTITAFARAPRDGMTALGLDDGSVVLGRIGVTTRFLSAPDDAADGLVALAPGESAAHQGGVATRTPIGQIRLAEPLLELAEPALLPEGAGETLLIDYQATASAEFLVALRADGAALYDLVTKITPLGGGPPSVELTNHRIPFAPPQGRANPDRLFVTGDGQSVFFIWNDGLCQRYTAADPDAITLAETVSLTDEGRRLTAAAFLIGARTLVTGDDAGGVFGWFSARDPAALTPDRARFVRAHTLPPQRAAIRAIGVSERDRSFITADADGRLVVRNMTSHKTIARLDAPAGSGADFGPIARVSLAPKGDAVLAFSDAAAFSVWALKQGHPDATFHSLFGKVWYEGEPAPAHVYQSSSGDDASEAKIGLMPLIWGTLKATVYAMLVATPIGILAAVFTSEFLGRRSRAVIKPVIETMASLPSVVLGFLAAIVIAPALARFVPAFLLGCVLVPLGVAMAAHMWHFVPARISAGLSAPLRLAIISIVMVAAGAASVATAPALEATLFRPTRADLAVMTGMVDAVPADQLPAWVGGRTTFTPEQARRLRADGMATRHGQIVRPRVDAPIEPPEGFRPRIRAWLDGVYGEAWPGWLLLAFPAAYALAALGIGRIAGPALLKAEAGLSALASAALELTRFGATLALAGALAYFGAHALQGAGLDPRDSIFGPFDQRNTLVVAIVMAVAIVPIIYTICDDAMSGVPESLRSASLASGATRWQTAIRVVLPVAASGVFSACMIGLGRAAGETMVVLMATGNTPIMSMSVFDGMRTLSANIATELPEAAKGESHYRMLFLCGLVLFAITFGINTIAEGVRQRVRRRSAAL